MRDRSTSEPGSDENSARRAARAQWQKHTAGVVHAEGEAEGTSSFFDAMTRTRYELQPWQPQLIRDWAPRGTVLEIGSGAGTDHSILRESADRSIAIDLALRGASLTAQRIALEGGRGIAVVADGENCPLEDESVDAVYSFGVIHHTDHPDRAVAEMARTLRPGGTFMVSVYHRYSLFALSKLISYIARYWWRGQAWQEYLAGLEYGAADQREPPVVRLYSRHEIRELFAQAGFTDLRTTTVHPYGFRMNFPRAFTRWGWYIVISGHKPL